MGLAAFTLWPGSIADGPEMPGSFAKWDSGRFPGEESAWEDDPWEHANSKIREMLVGLDAEERFPPKLPINSCVQKEEKPICSHVYVDHI